MRDVPVLIMINIYTGELMCWLVELQSSWSPLELYNIDPYHDISDTAQPLTNTLLSSFSSQSYLTSRLGHRLSQSVSQSVSQ